MKTCLFSVLAFIVILISGCSLGDEKIDKVEYVNLTVASKAVNVESMDSGLMNCIVVQESGKSYTLPLKWIEGFDYVEGCEYILRVKKTTPANAIQDAPQSFYYLIEILSKIKDE